MIKGEFTIQRCALPGVVAVEANTRHVFPRHTHNEFGIGVMLSGAHRSSSGRGMVEASAGDMLAVNPGEVHCGAPIGDRPRAWSMLFFAPPLIEAIARELSEPRTRACEFYRPVLRSARSAGLWRRLFAVMTARQLELSALRSEELMLGLFDEVLGEGGSPERDSAIPETIARARSVIDDAPERSVTLADLAHEAGLSRFQLLRAFARAAGMTPHAYQMQRRIDLARRLIAKRMPLAEAAAAAGFADQSHLTRVFTRKYGISPGAYASALA